MASYLDVAAFKLRTVMPSADVDALETSEPGWLLTLLTDLSGYIDSRLSKRYATSFASPPPVAILRWLNALATPEAYKKRGWNPSSAQDADILEAARRAEAELKEAADSKEGLFDLPLRQDTTGTSGITLGGPLGYSEASPYAWMDVQAEAVNGDG